MLLSLRTPTYYDTTRSGTTEARNSYRSLRLPAHVMIQDQGSCHSHLESRLQESYTSARLRYPLEPLQSSCSFLLVQNPASLVRRPFSFPHPAVTDTTQRSIAAGQVSEDQSDPQSPLPLVPLPHPRQS